ncbi:phosphate ABC transporter permease PstA [Acidihalobacter ferrooxydans]|uniref:Phosphate transport system permease protein PstA n=1 Tax=Acidihalobacter ferrooxydans TaxID=1765967 RepID=A0A1P8UFW3_9GAMM|nr:phosphate ABC transporter permease PstA [Acidihalobacter ferrooxydans]APZ42710.1 phosphate ABC transporter, permease protein PstA [Acidihalobacter ferrooxydans]
MSNPKYLRRRVINLFNMAVAIALTGLALFFLGWILYVLVVRGIGYINPALFLQSTPGAGIPGGGLGNAFVGSLIMSGLGIALATPIGILAATYLAEFGQRSRIATVVRFINDVLLSAPSIVIGVFVYGVVVEPSGHFSAWAGAIALAIIALPVTVRTTDTMLQLIPDQMREAAIALGTPRWKVTVWIVYRSSLAGIVTGVLLAFARIVGEAAPLLFTSLGNQFFTGDPNQPMAAVPQVLFNFAMGPYENWHQIAWAGALVSTLFVLVLMIVARLLSASSKR